MKHLVEQFNKKLYVLWQLKNKITGTGRKKELLQVHAGRFMTEKEKI